MEKRSLDEIMSAKSINLILQKVQDILKNVDSEDFEEKKNKAMDILRREIEGMKPAPALEHSVTGPEGEDICQAFWQQGNGIWASPEVLLRRVCDPDREHFLAVRAAHTHIKMLMEREAHRNALWDEHTGDTALMLSIISDGEYAGYCGIHDVTRERWEIAIELLPGKTGQGIGTLAISAMLDQIKARLGVKEFRVRIEPGNLASQRFFEKLGALPAGISPFLVHDPELMRECEEENLHLIDQTLISVAEKFSVEPRKLLTHALEYTLVRE